MCEIYEQTLKIGKSAADSWANDERLENKILLLTTQSIQGKDKV